MAARLADIMEAQLGRAIAERGSASLAVSGGSTPAGLYRALSERNLEWSKVTAVLVDERWVAPGEDGSNETFVRETLAQNKARELRLIGLWSNAPSPAAGLEKAERRLEDTDPPFDIVVMGMGPDGHTASWFPRAEGLSAALSGSGRLAAVTAKRSDVTGDHIKRMTLTLGAVKDARFICLMISGDEKRDVYARALEAGPADDMPVRAILRARPDLMGAWAP